MKNWIKFIIFLSITFCENAQAQVLLEADYTNTTRVKKNIQYPLNVFNRISPINGFRRPENIDKASLCLVRPLGGVATNGSPDLDRDTYKWDGENFITNFEPLKRQIDNVFNAGLDIHQIVLDNPSWDFQRDANGNLPGGSYLGETYGNAEPPTNFNAWAQYLRDVMNFLITTYDREKLADIQFGIGREIGTRGHWTGTQQEFFRFYRRSVEAVKSVMPEAKIGSHFLWGSANNAWGTDFVKWCKTNDVPYDFVGVSYYPAYNRANRTNFKQVYRNDFSVIKDIPEWNNNAKFEIHEFALTSSFGGNTFESAPLEYQNSFLVGWMKQFFENDINNLFQWGTGDHFAPANAEILELRGDTYHLNSINGTQNATGNYVDALFTSKPNSNELNIMAYNYNANPNSNTAEDLRLIANVNASRGSNYRYRSGIFNKATGSFTYSNWINSTTINGSGNTSQIVFNRSLPVFSFLKYEIEIEQNNPTANQAPTISINAPTANATFTIGQEITLSANASDPDGNLDKVNFKINDDFYKSVFIRPFQTTFTPEMVGVYKISALAIDKDNEKSEVSININVIQENRAPNITLTSPIDGSIYPVGNIIDLRADATDPDGNLDKVNFKINDNFYKTTLQRPFADTFTPDTPGTYKIAARAFDKDGLSTEIFVNITVSSTLSNNDFEKNKNTNNINIYPNPTTQELNITGIRNQNVAISIIDINGKKILNTITNSTSNKIDVSKLSNGFYFIRFNGNNSIRVLPFIKK